MSARYVNVTGVIVTPSNNKMQFQLPSNNTVPRGFYMLFALNTGGVLSVAAWVKVV